MSCLSCAPVGRNRVRAALVALAPRFHRCGTQPRLVVLSEDREQCQDFTLALRRAYDELAPIFGQTPRVASIVVKCSLYRSFGAELRAVVTTAERDGPPAYAIWLAFKPGGRYIGSDGVAAVLSDVLFALAERDGPVSSVLEVPVAVPAQTRDSRTGVAPQPRAVAKDEAEGTVLAFRPGPLGHDAPTRNGA